MTERTPLRGRRARWSAAFVVAPTAAAVFAATTAWSAAHDPTPASPSSGNSSGTSSGSGGSDVIALQQTLDDQAARVTALQAQLARLRAEAASLGHAVGTPVNPPPAGSTVTRASGTTRTTTRPPAVHAVTGGS
jgi:hypothetical protein